MLRSAHFTRIALARIRDAILWSDKKHWITLFRNCTVCDYSKCRGVFRNERGTDSPPSLSSFVSIRVGTHTFRSALASCICLYVSPSPVWTLFYFVLAFFTSSANGDTGEYFPFVCILWHHPKSKSGFSIWMKALFVKIKSHHPAAASPNSCRHFIVVLHITILGFILSLCHILWSVCVNLFDKMWLNFQSESICIQKVCLCFRSVALWRFLKSIAF